LSPQYSAAGDVQLTGVAAAGHDARCSRSVYLPSPKITELLVFLLLIANIFRGAE